MSGIAGLVLAAGLASRYRAAGGVEPSKVLALHEGEPMVRRVVRVAVDAGLHPVVVVTGHAAVLVEATLGGFPVLIRHNPDFSDGLASSLRCGVGALPPGCEAVVVLLGDMPHVNAALVRGIVDHARAAPSADAVVPVHRGERGNPVLLRSTLFPAVAALRGDTGAKALIRAPGVRVEERIVADDAVLFDVDLPPG